MISHLSVSNESVLASDPIQALDQNCDPSLSQSICVGANVLGLASTALWFIVLVPQIVKNFWRRSVAGLSFLWALANFTASLVNLFFAFTIHLPLFSRVSAVYMPALELTILVQFLLFHKLAWRRKMLFLAFCLLLWGGIVELELCLPRPATDHLEWIAIILWSVETFPQVVLNTQLRSTRGQSTLSVVITICGKTTDFLSTYALDMPLKYVIMAYFSSSMGLTNGCQLFWYGRRVWLEEGCSSCGSSCGSLFGQAATLRAGVHIRPAANSSGQEGRTVQAGNRDEAAMEPCASEDCKQPLLSVPRSPVRAAVCRRMAITAACIAGFAYCTVGLCVFVVGLWWRSRSAWSLLAPAVCVTVLLGALLAQHCKERGWHRTTTNWLDACCARVQTVLACV